ncbi:MAG TPA: hypothetical protein VIL35_15650 [Vicinamibacterales bacterium]
MDQPGFASLAALAGLGAFHGINPGMGWLFAVALGLQENRRAAVWKALLPLGTGHALAVAAVVLVAAAGRMVLAGDAVKYGTGVLLLLLGVQRLVRHRHPRFGGMRVGLAGLTAWSFLMATAHGAGLMVVPHVPGMAAAPAEGAACHTAAAGVNGMAAVTATVVHALAYLGVTALIAVFVYERVGLGLLRRAWINLDFLWALALLGTGLLTMLV